MAGATVWATSASFNKTPEAESLHECTSCSGQAPLKIRLHIAQPLPVSILTAELLQQRVNIKKRSWRVVGDGRLLVFGSLISIMDDWIIGSTSAADVDIQRRWTYPRSEALMSTSSGGGWQPLSRSPDSDADRLVLVPFDRDRKSVYAHREEVAELFELWCMPLAAVTWFFDLQDTPGLCSAESSTSKCIWYRVHTMHFHDEDWEHPMVYIWQSLDLATPRSRTLVFYPLIMKEHLLSALGEGLSAQSNMNTVTVHWILIRAAIATWFNEKARAQIFGLIAV